MKNNRFLILFMVGFMAIPVLSFGQDTTVINENIKKEKKISYAFINEYGAFVGGLLDDDGGLIYGATSTFVNGIRFNKTQDEIGIGLGSERLLFYIQGFPMYFNYRHYFLSEKKINTFINVGLGTQIFFWGNHEPDVNGNFDHKIYGVTGLYSTVAGGFRVKAFSFTAGIFIKSVEWRENFYGGGEIKAGFTF